MDITNFVMSSVFFFLLGMAVALRIAVWILAHPDWLKDKKK